MTKLGSLLWLGGLIGALVGFSALTPAQEVVTLSAPVIATATSTVMRPARVEFNVLLGTVQITAYPWVAGAFVTTGPPLNVTYNGSTNPTGAALIVSLNKANLSTTSLEKRILNQLIASGFLAGSVSGTPP